jgi:hypothetical protein
VSGRQLFDSWLFWACFQLILFVDTLLFTLGYIVEIPALKNRIRSVDPTFFGWFICLACYPPFNNFTSNFFPGRAPIFRPSTMTSRTTARTSHSSWRWLSTRGLDRARLQGEQPHQSRHRESRPLRFVRHPAYAAKNLAGG